jgi:hypothetical protein
MLTRTEAAALLGVPPRVLSNCARRRAGPPFYRMSGKLTLYRRDELLQWMAARRVAIEKRR